jgi:predicted PurR-regulated permease PerM
MPNSREAVPDILDPALAMALTRAFLSNIGGIFSTGLLVLFTVMFILLETAGMPAKLKAAFNPTAETEARIQKMLSSVNQYMVIKALAMALTRTFLSNIGGIFSTGLLVLFTVLFILLETAGMPAKLKAAFNPTAETEARIQKMLSSVNRYMVIKSLASLATAILIWVWLWYLGLDFAILWALLAFLLNFVPFIGAILMAVPAILLALVQTDIQTTLLVALGYLVVNTAIGSFLEPRFMGKGLGISTLAVFLSLLFWGFVFGTVGVFLSVPLTMVLIIALDASPLTRPIAILLGPEIAQTPGSAEDAGSVDSDPAAQQAQGLLAQKRQDTQQGQ